MSKQPHKNDLDKLFRDSFSEWNPKYSGKEMEEVWENVQQHITPSPTPSGSEGAAGSGGSTGAGGLFSGIKGLVWGAVATGVAVSGITLYLLNNDPEPAGEKSQTGVTQRDPSGKEVPGQNDKGIRNNPGKALPGDLSSADAGRDHTVDKEAKENALNSENNDLKGKNAGTQSPGKINAENNSAYTSATSSQSAGNEGEPGSQNKEKQQDKQGAKTFPRLIYAKELNSSYTPGNHLVLSSRQVCIEKKFTVKYTGANNGIDFETRIDGVPAGKFQEQWSKTFGQPGARNLTLIARRKEEEKIYHENLMVLPLPEAKFEYQIMGYKQVDFTNLSTGATTYLWEFDDGNASNQEDPVHQFKNSGAYLVRLVAVSQGGCKDIVRNNIRLENPEELTIPNVMTPNGDNKNDVFPNLSRNDIASYELVVMFPRQNKVVFTGENQSWDGTYDNSGKPCPEGKYLYRLEYRFAGEEKVRKAQGIVTLVRDF